MDWQLGSPGFLNFNRTIGDKIFYSKNVCSLTMEAWRKNTQKQKTVVKAVAQTLRISK